MAVTIKDVAREAGVSVATASRICGNYGYASDEAREKIEKACKKLGYYPNAIAKSMVKKQTRTIGLVVTDMHNDFYIKIIEEVEKNAELNGYSILFANSDEDLAKEKKAVKTLVERQVDGIILVPVGFRNQSPQGRRASSQSSHIEDLLRLNIPIVMVDRHLADLEVDEVLIENEKVAYESACRFIDQGNRAIGLVYPNQDISTIDDRKSGFLRALSDRGIPLSEERSIRCDFTSDSAYARVTEFLKAHKVDGFFALDYQMTLGVLMALANIGLAQHQELQVMGFDSLGNYAKLYPGKVTSIVQPVAEMGKVALDLLVERISSKNKGESPGKRRTIKLSV